MLFSLFSIISFYTFIELYLLIPAIIEHIFNPTAEFATPNETKAKIESHPLIVETKQVTVQCNSKLYKSFFLFTH